MRQRTGVLSAAPVILLLLLTACDPGGGAPTEPASPSVDDPSQPIVALPEDAVLAVTAVATAGNGAVLDVSLIVHAPQLFSADGAADAWAATTAWCAGEVEDAVIAGEGYTFATVDATATLREGDWPADVPLVIYPLPSSLITLAVGGDVRQADRLAELGDSPSPHCAWPALLDGPGSGQLYVGFPGDADGDGDLPPLSGWANQRYGVQANWLEEDPPSIAFTECIAQITELGHDLGAPSALWEPLVFDGVCLEGGAAPST
jgi:hypothetical protein